MTARNREPATKPRTSHPGPHAAANRPSPESPRLRSALWKPGEPFLLPILLALVMRVAMAASIPYASEDAYITFRFAENWAHGLGPVYNAGDPVMGFSSPLWTAWLALGSVFTGAVLPWARTWGIVFDLGALVVATRMLSREHGRFSGWIFAPFFALYPIFAANSVLGMETSLFLFLLFLAADRVACEKPDAGLWLGLLAIVRPESTVCALVLALRARWSARGIALGIAGVTAVALTIYFGSVIPQSVQGKAASYGLGGPLVGIHWIDGLLPMFLIGRWPATGEGTNLLPFALVGFPAVLVGWRVFWGDRRQRRAVPLVALAGLVVLLAYFLSGVPYFFWYAVVPVAAWMLTASVGLPALSRHRLLYASLALYLVSDSFLLRNLFVERVRQEVISFWQTGEALKTISGGKGTVFLEPAGHIGYVTGLTLYDEVGLLAPDVAQRRKSGAGWYFDFVTQRRPDYLVVRDGFLDRNEGFAGATEPFRSGAELEQVKAAYEVVPFRVRGVAPGLTILRRKG